MSSLTRRQIWLAQTALPEDVKREIINMERYSRGMCSKPDSQAILLKAQESVRAREGVKRAFHHSTARMAGRQRTHTHVFREIRNPGRVTHLSR